MKEKLTYAFSLVVVSAILTVACRFSCSSSWLEALGVGFAAAVANVVVDALLHRYVFAKGRKGQQ